MSTLLQSYFRGRSHLRNVFRFYQVINIKQNLDRNTKLEQIVDDPLHSVSGLHLVCGGRSLLLAERSWTTFENDLLDDPGCEETSKTVFQQRRRDLLSILKPAGVFSNITNFSGHLGGNGGRRYQSRYIYKGSLGYYLVHKFDHFGLSLRLRNSLLLGLLRHLKIILRHPSWRLD